MTEPILQLRGVDKHFGPVQVLHGVDFTVRAGEVTALVGDKFTATVNNTTVGTNGATIRAGTTVVLEVSSVERANPAENSRIHFRVRAIDVNGESYPADGEVATLSTMETSRVSTALMPSSSYSRRRRRDSQRPRTRASTAQAPPLQRPA